MEVLLEALGEVAGCIEAHHIADLHNLIFSGSQQFGTLVEPDNADVVVGSLTSDALDALVEIGTAHIEHAGQIVDGEVLVRQIVENAGLEGSVVVNTVKGEKGDYGYNARADRYEDLRKAGIIDPAKVARVALENAASIAGMFLTTECVITDKKEENPAPAMPNPGMGGMM